MYTLEDGAGIETMEDKDMEEIVGSLQMHLH